MKKQLACMVLTGLIVLLSISSCAQKQIPPTSTATPTAIATPIPTQALTMPVDGRDITCKDAADYYKKGDIALANQAYLAILEKTPLAKCALEGSAILSELLSPTKTVVPTPTLSPTITPNAATVVPALIKVGDYSGAYEKAKEGISADPEIQKSINRDFLNWFVVKNFISTFVLPIFFILLIIAIVFVVYPKFKKIFKAVQLDLKGLSSGSFFIDEKNMGALGESITARMELYLKRWFDTKLTSVTALVNSPICLPELPSNVPSQIRDFWTLITKLFPPRVLTVEGLLEVNQIDGIGLSIKIIDERAHKYVAHEVFWANKLKLNYLQNGTKEDKKIVKTKSTTNTTELPKNIYSSATKNSTETTINSQATQDINPDKFFELADIAAAWIFWKYCEFQKFDLKQIFGTDIIESYLWYVRSTYFSVDSDDLEYLNISLEKDYQNTLALINKARISLHNYRKTKHVISWDQFSTNIIDLFHQVLTLRKNYPKDTIKVLANYSLGVIYLDKSIEKIDPESAIGTLTLLPEIDIYDGYFSDAYDEISELLCDDTNNKCDENIISNKFIYAAQLPHIGFMIWKNHDGNLWFDQFQTIENDREKTASILYNLSCAYNRFSLSNGNPMINKLIDTFNPQDHYPYKKYPELEAKHNIQNQSKKALQIALIYFEEACKANPSIAADLRKNPKSDETFKFMQYVFPEEFNRIIGKK